MVAYANNGLFDELALFKVFAHCSQCFVQHKVFSASRLAWVIAADISLGRET